MTQITFSVTIETAEEIDNIEEFKDFYQWNLNEHAVQTENGGDNYTHRLVKVELS